MPSATADEAELERLIVELARPLVTAIVSRNVRGVSAADIDDVVAEVDLRLMKKLRSDEPVENVQGYVATLAYNACNDLLRRRFPERARLKNRLRYALTTDARLTLWPTPSGLACGLREWAGREVVDAPPLPASSSADALVDAFRAAGGPVLLDALVDTFETEPGAEPSDEEPAVMPPDAAVEDRDFARALWREVRELRPMQRKALLLNLRYGGELDAIAVLVLSNIATFADVAGALEVSESELAAMWNDLPYDDLRIAELLGVTRQQVINLRKAARARLARRLPR